MTVREIIEKWLKDNKYDGLYSYECGCEIGDLAPCSESCWLDCEPGVKSESDSNDYDFIIGPREEEK